MNLQSWWQRNVTARLRERRIRQANSHISWAKSQAKLIFQDNTYKQQTEIADAIIKEIENLKELRIVYLEGVIQETQREIQEIINSK